METVVSRRLLVRALALLDLRSQKTLAQTLVHLVVLREGLRVRLEREAGCRI